MASLRAYSLTGVRPDADFFLWKITERYEDLGELGAALNGTPLAGWLATPYSYLATTKASQYTKARKPRQVVPTGSPYLVVYPFVKVRPWYALPHEDREEGQQAEPVPDRREEADADVEDHQQRRAVEDDTRARRPHRDLLAAVAPGQEDEVRDRQEERDPGQDEERRQRLLELEHDH